MDLDITGGEEIPEHDTRLLVKNASNYLPEYTNLVKVIADPNIIDGMLLRAVSGDVVRYTGVRSSVSTTREKPSILFPTFSKILGTKKVSEVIREDVEGLIWARAAEVDNVAINRKQLCSLEFPTSYHTTLDTFCEVPGIINLLSHPQVSIPIIKSCISLFGKNELSFLSRVFGFKGALVQNTSQPVSLMETSALSSKVVTLNDTDMLQSLDNATFERYNYDSSSKEGISPITFIKTDEILTELGWSSKDGGGDIPVKNSGITDFIAQALQQAKILEVGEGVCLGTASSKTLYLVKSDETYSITSVDLSPLIAIFGASCKDLICAPKLSVTLSNLAELEKVRVKGFGPVASSFAVVLPGELEDPRLMELIIVPMRNSLNGKLRTNCGIELLDANMPKLMTLLHLPDIKGSEKEILDDILKSPKNILLVDGIIKLLSLPLEDKLLYSLKQKYKASLKLAPHGDGIDPDGLRRYARDRASLQKIYYAAKEMADSAYSIGTADKRSIGIVIKPASLVKNRHYLKWSDGEFKIVVGSSRWETPRHSSSSLDKRHNYPPHSLATSSWMLSSEQVNSNGILVTETLQGDSSDIGEKEGGMRPVPPPSQVDFWNKHTTPGYFLPCPPFIATADLAEIEVLFQTLGEARKLKLASHEQFRPSAVGKLNAENGRNKRSVKTSNGDQGFLGLIGKMSQIYTLNKNQKVLILDAADKAHRVYASRDENGIFKVIRFDATPINLVMRAPVATEKEIAHHILDQLPEPARSAAIAETAGTELTKLINSGLSLEESILSLTQDTRFKPGGSNTK